VPTTAGNGWTAYESLPGKAPVAGDLDSELVELLAEYVSARAADFTATDGDVSKLEEMVRFNAGQLWGRNLEHGFRLPVERPVIADGRMMPYEWRRSGEKILKLDAGAHGDNHFFPGPVDIAWDLAGAIVEWDMSAQHRGAFLDRYRARSGDNAEHRMSEYIVAYCAFQAGYAQMAAAAMAGSAEAKRFQRELARYARAAVHHGPITGVRNRIPRSRPPLSPARQM
jgi:hypothetical protein